VLERTKKEGLRYKEALKGLIGEYKAQELEGTLAKKEAELVCLYS